MFTRGMDARDESILSSVVETEDDTYSVVLSASSDTVADGASTSISQDSDPSHGFLHYATAALVTVITLILSWLYLKLNYTCSGELFVPPGDGDEKPILQCLETDVDSGISSAAVTTRECEYSESAFVNYYRAAEIENIPAEEIIGDIGVVTARHVEIVQVEDEPPIRARLPSQNDYREIIESENFIQFDYDDSDSDDSDPELPYPPRPIRTTKRRVNKDPPGFFYGVTLDVIEEESADDILEAEISPNCVLNRKKLFDRKRCPASPTRNFLDDSDEEVDESSSRFYSAILERIHGIDQLEEVAYSADVDDIHDVAIQPTPVLTTALPRINIQEPSSSDDDAYSDDSNGATEQAVVEPDRENNYHTTTITTITESTTITDTAAVSMPNHIKHSDNAHRRADVGGGSAQNPRKPQSNSDLRKGHGVGDRSQRSAFSPPETRRKPTRPRPPSPPDETRGKVNRVHANHIDHSTHDDTEDIRKRKSPYEALSGDIRYARRPLPPEPKTPQNGRTNYSVTDLDDDVFYSPAEPSVRTNPAVFPPKPSSNWSNGPVVSLSGDGAFKRTDKAPPLPPKRGPPPLPARQPSNTNYSTDDTYHKSSRGDGRRGQGNWKSKQVDAGEDVRVEKKSKSLRKDEYMHSSDPNLLDGYDDAKSSRVLQDVPLKHSQSTTAVNLEDLNMSSNKWQSSLRSKSLSTFLLDQECGASDTSSDVLSTRVLSEREKRIQKSLEDLELPDWYKNSTIFKTVKDNMDTLSNMSSEETLDRANRAFSSRPNKHSVIDDVIGSGRLRRKPVVINMPYQARIRDLSPGVGNLERHSYGSGSFGKGRVTLGGYKALSSNSLPATPHHSAGDPNELVKETPIAPTIPTINIVEGSPTRAPSGQYDTQKPSGQYDTQKPSGQYDGTKTRALIDNIVHTSTYGNPYEVKVPPKTFPKPLMMNGTVQHQGKPIEPDQSPTSTAQRTVYAAPAWVGKQPGSPGKQLAGPSERRVRRVKPGSASTELDVTPLAPHHRSKSTGDIPTELKKPAMKLPEFKIEDVTSPRTKRRTSIRNTYPYLNTSQSDPSIERIDHEPGRGPKIIIKITEDTDEESAPDSPEKTAEDKPRSASVEDVLEGLLVMTPRSTPRGSSQSKARSSGSLSSESSKVTVKEAPGHKPPPMKPLSTLGNLLIDIPDGGEGLSSPAASMTSSGVFSPTATQAWSVSDRGERSDGLDIAGLSKEALREQEDIIVERVPKRNRGRNESGSSGEDVIYVKCRRCKKCEELSDAKRSYKTCHNCYTYYCSRDCRKTHWERHKQRCIYSRINSTCKHMLTFCRYNPDVQQALTRTARRGHLQRGKGAVLAFFSGIDEAEQFMKDGVVNTPEYYPLKDIDERHDLGEQKTELLEYCQNYNPEIKFVLNVAIMMPSRTSAKGALPRHRGPYIQKCNKIRLFDYNTSSSDDMVAKNSTLILTSPANAPTKASNLDKKARQICFINIQRKLRQRGVSLRFQFPEVYNRLCCYVEDGIHFTPITIYPADGDSGRRFMCLIMPDSEPDFLGWVNDPDLVANLAT